MEAITTTDPPDDHATTMLRERGSRDTCAESALLTVRDMARFLNCSTKTIYRLHESGHMPPPVRLGALVRWPTTVIEHWVDAGCPKTKRSA
ncbi:MAG: helix-turn-helix domain-containing protein [Planctomycetes bacterium]|nr:helix-turn-helix domain-containing protein [Planctomycetota bacterium]